jgi:hypothetical protein
MKRVQHDEIKPGMKIKLAHHGPRGRWVAIEHVYEVRTSSPTQEACAHTRAFYVSDQNKKRFSLMIYADVNGYELHPQSALLAAQEVQRAGRGDVQNLVLREYSLKLCVVDRVDNQGEPCGYCNGANGITTNVYAKVFEEGNASGRPVESAWSTCTTCTVYSLDQVEDVDPSHTVTLERAYL